MKNFELFSTSIGILGSEQTDEVSDQKTFIVYGVPRGGTTMVARVVEQLGVPMGKNLPLNYEDQDFNFDKMSDQLKADPALMHQALRRAIRKRNQEYQVWGWKYPRAHRYLPAILENIRRPHLICVMRDPVASSFRPLRRKSNGSSSGREASALRLMKQHLNWQEQNLDLIHQFGCPALMCSYEKSILQPDDFVRELSGFMGLGSDEVNVQRAIEQIKPGSYIQA